MTAPAPISVVEMLDLTELAAPLGFRCHVSISTQLAERLDVPKVLERLRDVLLATGEDPDFAIFRATALHGAPSPTPRLVRDAWDEMKVFLARARAGVGGINVAGDMLSFT